MTWDTFFLKNHTQNVVEKLFPDPFRKNQNWVYLWITSLKFLYSLFFLYATLRVSKYIETKLQITCFYLILSFFKRKEAWNIFLPYFLHNFWRKIFLLYSINWPNFIDWLPLLCEIGWYVLQLFFNQVLTSYIL